MKQNTPSTYLNNSDCHGLAVTADASTAAVEDAVVVDVVADVEGAGGEMAAGDTGAALAAAVPAGDDIAEEPFAG